MNTMRHAHHHIGKRPPNPYSPKGFGPKELMELLPPWRPVILMGRCPGRVQQTPTGFNAQAEAIPPQLAWLAPHSLGARRYSLRRRCGSSENLKVHRRIVGCSDFRVFLTLRSANLQENQVIQGWARSAHEWSRYSFLCPCHANLSLGSAPTYSQRSEQRACIEVMPLKLAIASAKAMPRA